jgi:hypothetical protein
MAKDDRPTSATATPHPKVRGLKGSTADAPRTNPELDEEAALPEGALSGPFLDPQGDEHRPLSEKERKRLADIRSRQRTS